MKKTRRIVRIILICLLAFFLLRSLFSLKEGFTTSHLPLGDQSEVNKFGTETQDAGDPNGTIVTDGNPAPLCNSISDIGKWCDKWRNGLAKEVTNPETIECAGNECEPDAIGELCCKQN